MISFGFALLLFYPFVKSDSPIVDLGYVKPDAVTEITKKLVRGGIDLLQLRAKGVPIDEVRRIAQVMVAITQPAGVPFILNDYPQLLADVPAEGCHLAIVSSDDHAIAAATQQLRESGASVIARTADLSRAADCAELVEWAVSELGGLDVLINNTRGPRLGLVQDLATSV